MRLASCLARGALEAGNVRKVDIQGRGDLAGVASSLGCVCYVCRMGGGCQRGPARPLRLHSISPFICCYLPTLVVFTPRSHKLLGVMGPKLRAETERRTSPSSNAFRQCLLTSHRGRGGQGAGCSSGHLSLEARLLNRTLTSCG